MGMGVVGASETGVERWHLLWAPFYDGRIEHGVELVRGNCYTIPSHSREEGSFAICLCQLTGKQKGQRQENKITHRYRGQDHGWPQYDEVGLWHPEAEHQLRH